MSGWRYAFSLSKDEVAASQPPGTVLLISHSPRRPSGVLEPARDHIELQPRPSLSPADPLNWPLWRKCTILLILSLYAALGDFAGSALAPTIPVLIHEIRPQKSTNDLTRLVSLFVLMFGVGNMIWMPFSNVFGRRAMLLLSTLIFTLASVWCGLATDYSSFLGARAIQGLGGGCVATVGPDVLSEIFFVHQRGRAMAVFTCFLGTGSLVGGISGGYLGNIGYKNIFWTCTAFGGVVLIGCFFFISETLFDRTLQLQREDSFTGQEEDSTDDKGRSTRIERVEAPQPFTYIQSLKIGVYRGGLLHQLVTPYLALRLPGTWVVMLQFGGLLGSLVAISLIGPITLSGPPYLWGSNNGLFNIGGLIGSVLGGFATYFMVDRLVVRNASHESHGYSEPEGRLLAMFPALFIATTGNWIFGFCAESKLSHAWVGISIGAAMVAFGISQIPSIGFNYLIESYYSISGNCFLMVVLFRSVISFTWTLFVDDWVTKDGAGEAFGIFGMMMGVFGLLTIPLFLYGKRLRIATAKWLPSALNH